MLDRAQQRETTLIALTPAPENAPSSSARPADLAKVAPASGRFTSGNDSHGGTVPGTTVNWGACPPRPVPPLAADRAAVTATESGDRLAVAEAAYCRCMTLRHSGRIRTAYAAAVDAAAQLADEGLRTPDDLATYGHLFLTSGYSAAAAGDAARAEDYMREAEAVAARLGNDVTHGMWFFGPAQAGLYRLSMENALGNVGGGVAAARALDPARLPTPERRARCWIDTARVYAQWTGHRADVATAVRHAFAEAPGEVVSRPAVLQLAHDAGLKLVTTSG